MIAKGAWDSRGHDSLQMGFIQREFEPLRATRMQRGTVGKPRNHKTYYRLRQNCLRV